MPALYQCPFFKKKKNCEVPCHKAMISLASPGNKSMHYLSLFTVVIASILLSTTRQYIFLLK